MMGRNTSYSKNNYFYSFLKTKMIWFMHEQAGHPFFNICI
ncbi:hypothetical protein I656_00443 [Geobacillus sp. WSUCF1]|nr:hypothetical protein I656_00443 [Geobacillus sp. WSUCF1]